MIINFKEIPQANLGSGLQDTFELFSREFLEAMGFTIIEHPDRGADGKKDMIVSETRSGIGGETVIKWLVSCKHYIHSGKSINDTDEPDIIDRVAAHKCEGFIGFYSTLPATSLSNKLKGYKNRLEYIVFDKERIERELLKSADRIKLASRFFPISVSKHLLQNPKPAKIFQEEPELNCQFCGKDLLKTKNGIFVVWSDGKERIGKNGFSFVKEQDVYYSCKGTCDNRLDYAYRNKGLENAGWNDIDDLLIPTLFIKSIMAYLNQLSKETVSHDVHEKMKHIYLNTFPHVLRDLTDKEKKRVKLIMEFGL